MAAYCCKYLTNEGVKHHKSCKMLDIKDLNALCSEKFAGFGSACIHWHIAFGPPVKGAQPPHDGSGRSIIFNCETNDIETCRLVFRIICCYIVSINSKISFYGCLAGIYFCVFSSFVSGKVIRPVEDDVACFVCSYR